MAIKKIHVSNFKSFKDLKLELGNFNVVIGANASGKSNFTQIFRFIRDIANLGLDNAVSLQGSEYLSNLGVRFPQVLRVSLKVAPDTAFGIRLNESVVAKMNEVDYQFALKFGGKGTGFEIEKDSITFRLDYARWSNSDKGKPEESRNIGTGALVIRNDNGTPKFSLKRAPNKNIKAKNIFPSFLREPLQPKTLLLQIPYFLFPLLQDAFSEIAIYDFDPKLSKKAVPVAGKSELEEDGSNLSLVLKSVVEDKAKKRKFSNLVKDLLPFVEDLSTDKFADRSLLFKLQESYFPKVFFPASFISDGTVNISALLIALYFDKKPLTIIEEPERNIHPHLISKVLDMMKDASKKKQIIVTTHSPEVVKHADLENILLVSRNKDGFSSISRPSQRKEVKIFLKNEMGLEELYVDNLLEG
ncbi:MAG: AAA family ATPase [Planctomycetes bacterium]|nr:AAA family ATPase [Planctomycetota bacterium]